MRVCGVTDIGCQRKDNQDSYAIRHLDGEAVLLVVCDGMGGAQAGSVASAVAVEEFTSAVEEGLGQGSLDDPSRWEQVLSDACSRANTRVFQLSTENTAYAGMGTTLVAALILPGAVCMVHVGDSRGYLLEDGEIRQVTVDHSLVQMLVDRGEITPDQARIHPQKNLITRALGVDSHVEYDLNRLSPRPGSRLLLCSDGLSNMLEDRTLLCLSGQEEDPGRFCQRLLEQALERGAPDNVTVVLAQL